MHIQPGYPTISLSSRGARAISIFVTFLGRLQNFLTLTALILVGANPAMATDLAALSSNYESPSYVSLLRTSRNPQPLNFMGHGLTGFWADQSPAFQAKIDRGFELILSTPSGMKWLQDLRFKSSVLGKTISEQCRPDRVRVEETRSSREQMESEREDLEELARQLNFFWGMSLPLAQKLIGLPQKLDSVMGSRAVFLKYADGRTVQLFPKLYFLSRERNPTRIDSYTSADNKTIAVIGDTQDPDAELLGVLTHEAMITGDAKSDLLHWATQRNFRDLSEWRTKLADPTFNSVLATMRAFHAEALVMSDLSRTARRNSPSGTNGNSSFAWGPSADLVTYLSMTPQSCVSTYQRMLRAKYLMSLGVSETDRNDLLKYLDVNSTLIRCDGTRVNACLELIGIEAGTRVKNSSGPRPRVGNDW